ncbi:hypothetical protein [Shouchella clausii]|uniref:Uncharacterized protein n=1 Tax=Shouchella clausii TaxID=79880 RepID=A0A268NVW3_SHOCL|nr:hypothetical protein [Shouchella clausii]PAE87626.1 hypothetical protein CHH72_17210 [Shouchella clausii]
MTVVSNPKPKETITVKQANTLLRAAKMRLFANRSEGQFIYCVVDKNGVVASASSRLEKAVAIAAEKAM